MKAVVFDNKPIEVALTQGEQYYFCTCGRAVSQPFCDGSHHDSGMSPQAFTAQHTGVAYLCQCKRTNNPPFCDGSHSAISDDEVGK